MKKLSGLLAVSCAAAICVCGLAACSQGQSSSNASNTSNSAVSSNVSNTSNASSVSNSAANTSNASGGANASGAASSGSAGSQTVEEEFYTVKLPESFAPTSSDNTYADEKYSTTFAVDIHDMTAAERLDFELHYSDFAEGPSVTLGGREYKTAIAEKWSKVFYIADYGEGCVEVTVDGNISDTDTINEFLRGLKLDDADYAKWLEAAENEKPQPGRKQANWK